MRKVRNRWLSIALAVIVGLALVLPLAPQQAQAASTYQMSYVARVKAPYSGEIGTLIISMDGISASEAKDSEVVLSLPSSPSGYKLVVDQAKIKGTNYFGRGAKFEVQQISDTTVKLKVNAVNKKGDLDKTSLISIPLEVTIPSGVSGDVILTIEAPDKSQFSRGSIVIARVVPAKVELAVESVPVIGSAGGKIGVIELKETVAKALYESPVTLSLPSGFKWADKNLNKLEDGTYSGSDYATVVWGDEALKGKLEFEVKNDARDLKISDKSDQGTEEATFLKLQLYVLPIETEAEAGDVKVSVSGASPSELVVARYGDYGVNVKSVSTETVLAGKPNQKIGKFALEEVIPGSLVKDRTIVLTLPDQAKWVEVPKIDEDNSKLHGLQFSKINDKEFFAKINDQTVRAKVDAQSVTDPAYVVIKGGKITVAADFSGDIELAISGSAGASGKVKVAEVKAPVSVSVSGATQVIIGEQNQAAGELTLTEAKKGALKRGEYIELKLPAGVTFASVPTFAVTEGNLNLSTAELVYDDSVARVKVEASSTVPSTIKVSNIKLTLTRNVPEGDIQLKVGGRAVVENSADFPGKDFVAKVAIAKCVTPAPPETIAKAVFKIGEKKYTVDGKEYLMDVAPYIEEGRTYVPLRYAAYACGVEERNILWDDVTLTATILKGDRVVQMTLGSYFMVVNGVQIPMDVKVQAKDGRIMLPIRWLSPALGFPPPDWKEDTQEVVILCNVTQVPGQAS